MCAYPVLGSLGKYRATSVASTSVLHTVGYSRSNFGFAGGFVGLVSAPFDLDEYLLLDVLFQVAARAQTAASAPTVRA